MTVSGAMALVGLFLAGWAYQADDGTTFAWGLALIASAPLASLLIGSPDDRKAAAVAASPDASPPPSSVDAEVAAKIAAYNAARQAYYEQHVKR